uniref:Uncharacterized protein n=1 Tax=Oryza brachyantha TaxID=4533 RepID=J3NF97_ORYBR
MEVGLTYPRSGRMVAPGTIQKNDKNAISVDGQMLNDYVDILVNTIFNQHTLMPRVYGMITTLGKAQACCIPWPRGNLMHPGGQALHCKVSAITRQISSNQGEKSANQNLALKNKCLTVHCKVWLENVGDEDTYFKTKNLGNVGDEEIKHIKCFSRVRLHDIFNLRSSVPGNVLMQAILKSVSVEKPCLETWFLS